MFNQGVPFAQISEKIGCHELSIGHFFKKIGFKRNFSDVKQKDTVKNKYPQIREMFKKGISQREISKTLGLNETTLLYHVKKEKLNA